MREFLEVFEELEGPRYGNAKLHDLHELLLTAICTIVLWRLGGDQVFLRQRCQRLDTGAESGRGRLVAAGGRAAPGQPSSASASISTA